MHSPARARPRAAALVVQAFLLLAIGVLVCLLLLVAQPSRAQRLPPVTCVSPPVGAHSLLSRTDRFALLTRAPLDPTVWGLLSDYLCRLPVHLTPSRGADRGWTANSGWRFLTPDDLWGYGPHLAFDLPVLAISIPELQRLNPAQPGGYYIPLLLEAPPT